MKKREEELARIRAAQKLATTGNFAKMRGNLPWPSNGTIINEFGLHNNDRLNTVYENIGNKLKDNCKNTTIFIFTHICIN